MDVAQLVAEKAALRTRMRALRRALVRDEPQADWQAGDKAEEMLAALKTRLRGKTAALYKASGSEMDPRPLGEALLKLDWTLALPACHEIDAPVSFHAWKPGDKLAADTVGILSPLQNTPQVRPDLIIAPVLAFDPRGHRLGQGGGYYDRTLALLRQSSAPPPVVGLAFAAQEVEHVPAGEHDQKLDAILTERGYRALR